MYKTDIRMSIEGFFLIRTKNWKQFKCPSTVEWVNILWYIHTMEEKIAGKRNKLYKQQHKVEQKKKQNMKEFKNSQN